MEAFCENFFHYIVISEFPFFCIPNWFALITSISLAMSSLYNINKKANFSLQINSVIALMIFPFYYRFSHKFVMIRAICSLFTVIQ